jgi:cellulose synthase/poly-beta-1,6-N-acetylglucosamine synthase-like glycosyltransferase
MVGALLGAGSLFAGLGNAVTDWLTLSLAITWTVAGVILVLLGWLTLPRRRSKSPEDQEPTKGSPAARVIGGALLAAVATIVAAYTLLRGQGWASDGLAIFLVAATAFGRLLLSIPFITLLGRLGYYIVVGGLAILAAFQWVGAQVMSGGPFAVVNVFALAVAAAVGGFAGWLSTGSRWRASGVFTYLGLDLVALGLIGFSLVLIESSHGAVARTLGIVFVGIEIFGLILFLAYQFYTLEYIAGRQSTTSEAAGYDPSFQPFVLVQVACYNEPIAIVRETLAAIRNIHYPRNRYEVQLVDDSTDPALVKQLGDLCLDMGVRFQHRRDRRGFKGGALNDALRAVYPPPDVVAIVDSDYVVDPEFLRIAVQSFRNPRVGFVQTPQAYRNAVSGTFARWYALADAYFYQVIQPVRARVQSLIFCGTMGMVRVTALREAGGWSEICVTEDAELSLRLLAKGWRGVYIPKTLGWGLAPEEMSAVRSQHRRWAFGGLQMLRMNRDSLTDPSLTTRQKRDFRLGGVFWLDGLFIVSLTGALAAIVIATWFGIQLPLTSEAAVAIVASAPLLLMLDGVFKIRVALRSSTPVRYRDILGIMGFWFAIKINDLRAALRGWSGAKLAFVRTPKEKGGRVTRAAALRSAMAASKLETSMGFTLLAIGAITAYRWGVFTRGSVSWPEWFLLGWLMYYAMVFLAAMLYDFFSQTAKHAPGRTAPAPRPVGARAERSSSMPQH